MIGKNTTKRIKSLALKKYRQKEELFLVEGDKNVLEVLHSTYQVEQLLATENFLSKNSNLTKHAKQITEVTVDEIKKVSLLKNPQNSLAICALPVEIPLPEKLEKDLSLYLDGIQDPGNLGTLIRICDWFGISQLFCSPDTANLYNPKVIQSSMGSFCRVQVWYSPFETLLSVTQRQGTPVFGTFLNGKSIYTEKLPSQALLVVGNEGNGIRESVGKKIENKITIPRFTQKYNGAESLNAAVATGIICAEFIRQQLSA
ncbi:MAG TPA: RNA methyltransferase [Draconibacterium sp.]|nr:RNA methyltransferase [Draconibacterium sp.]